MNNILEISHVTKSFDGVTALSDLSLTLESGRSMGIVGPNGSGRSTLLKLVIATMERDSGQIKISGDLITSINKPKISQVGSLIETPDLFPYMTGIDHLRLYSNSNEKIERIVSELQLANFIEKPVSTYAFAMKQKLGLAQALVNDAPLILLDEPTIGLTGADIKNLHQVIQQKMAQGTSFVINGQTMAEIMPLTDNLTYLDSGKIVNKHMSKRHPTVILETSDDVLARSVLEQNGAPLIEAMQLTVRSTDEFSLIKSVELLSQVGVNIYRLEARH